MRKLVLAGCLLLSAGTVQSQSDALLSASTMADITPQLPVAVTGQFHLRIAHTAETPLYAGISVIESRKAGKVADQLVVVACDVLYVPTDLISELRAAVRQKEPGIDVHKIIVNATHTHTAPVLRISGEYDIPKTGVLQVATYRRFFVDKVSDGIVRAYQARKPATVSWGLSYAVAGYNRRISYADGTAGMSSRTDLPEFRNLEGPEDHDINTLFVWDNAGKLQTIFIGVASPSQEVEGREAVNADFWHPVREQIRSAFGPDVHVIPLLSAAGDLTPHLRYRKAADDRMRELRKLERTEELARRIVGAVKESYETVKNDRYENPVLIHKHETVQLPERMVTWKDYTEASEQVKQADKEITANPASSAKLYRKMTWQQLTLDRYRKQQAGEKMQYPMELHVVRLGNIAFSTNEFELFSDYGIRIQSRSRALQTFIVQLAGSPEWGSYLPTEKAVKGGAYSAVIHSSRIGPEGGQVLVERSVALINSLWPEK